MEENNEMISTEEMKDFFIWFCKKYDIREDYSEHTLEKSFWSDYSYFKEQIVKVKK